MDYFRVDRIRKTYDDFDLEASLSCARGEQLAILGPSGSGKTTLLRILAGLIAPDSGSICLQGQEVAGLPARKRGIGLVFQDFALFPHLDVGENIAYGLRVQGIKGREVQRRVEVLLERFALPGFARRRVAELSGGERQRVALARALAVEPALILFDEPLASLDAELRRELRDELRHLQHELGFTSVLVTHDQEDALSSADRVAVMHEGRVVRFGTPEEVYQDPGSIWTAGFVGNGNLLPNMPGFAWHDPAQPEGAMFLARPELLCLAVREPASPGILRFTVRVSESVYQGRSWLVKARAVRARGGEAAIVGVPGASARDDGPVLAFHSPQKLDTGVAVELELDRRQVKVLDT